MSVAVRFLDGLAAGQTKTYVCLAVPLPSLWWSTDSPGDCAVYRRDDDGWPASTGVWPYRYAGSTTGERLAPIGAGRAYRWAELRSRVAGAVAMAVDALVRLVASTVAARG